MTNEATTPTVDWTEWTADQLAGFGDRVERAQAERAQREHAERQRQRRRDSDERRLAKIDAELPNLEAAIAERRPAVEELEHRFDEQREQLAGMLNERDAVPASRAAEYNNGRARLDEIAKALTQARLAGAELVEGARAVQVGEGVRYEAKSVRITHPLLQELAPEVNWIHPLQPMVDRLDELTKERDKLQARLKVTE